ncbi:MAG: PQ-loop repeat-containing protein [Candidatus Paceibacterota bacterium]|jgi:uncharacterized protein with PQ loop repeat
MPDLTHLFGFLASLMSLVIACIGFPAQIVKNYRRKSCEGLSLLLVWPAFAGYTLWTIYGLLKSDWFLFVPQGLGIIFSGILVIQVFAYRKEGHPPQRAP